MSATESPTRALRNPLTKRQTSIVAALAAGEWRKNIASDHGVSQVTTHTWIAQAKTAARANTAEHLIAMAVKEGWIE